MFAVDTNFTRPVNIPATSPFDDLNNVPIMSLNGITVVQSTGYSFRNVLNQCTATDNVQGLHTGANGKNRQSHFDGELSHATIKVFTADGHRSCVRMWLHPQPHWIQIHGTPSKHNAITHIKSLPQIIITRVRRNQHWQPTRSVD